MQTLSPSRLTDPFALTANPDAKPLVAARLEERRHFEKENAYVDDVTGITACLTRLRKENTEEEKYVYQYYASTSWTVRRHLRNRA
jgi:hypothetical protein